MTTFEIVLVVVLAIWLMQYISWGIRVKRVIKNHKEAMMEQHPAAPQGGNWPPDEVGFP
jgi:hypothetical protein